MSLLKAGHHVRAIERDINSAAALELKDAGATLIASGFKPEQKSNVGSLHFDEKTVATAFSNVDGAFILIPPNLSATTPQEEIEAFLQMLKNCIEHAENLKKVVFLSSCGAQQDKVECAPGTHRLEALFRPLASAKKPFIFLRPASFFSNLDHSLNAAKDGVFPTPFSAQTKVEMISPDDVGEEAARRLVEETERPLEIVELSGPRAICSREISEMLSAIIGKEVRHHQMAADTLAGTYSAHGISEKNAKCLCDIAEGIEGGTVTFENKEGLTRGSTDIKDYLAATLTQN